MKKSGLFIAIIELIVCCFLAGTLIVSGLNGGDTSTLVFVGFFLLFFQRELHRSIDDLRR